MSRKKKVITEIEASRDFYDKTSYGWMFFFWIIVLCVPNMVYSGMYWHDTLHIIKWAVVGFSIIAIASTSNFRILKLDDSIKSDIFGLMWLLMIVYMFIQLLWIKINSTPSFIVESLAFFTVIASYIYFSNYFKSKYLSIILWIASFCGVLSVCMAEMQRHHPEMVISLYPLIMNVVQYIANTGQANMFALWISTCILSSLYLLVKNNFKNKFLLILSSLFLFANMYGLFAVGSRSSLIGVTLSIIAFFVVYFICIPKEKTETKEKKNILLTVIIIAIMVYPFSLYLHPDIAERTTNRMAEMVEETTNIAGRANIWATTYSMFKTYPYGVGLGQYKWHYLEAQRERFKDPNTHPRWDYTNWAHNEFFQWFCEAGFIGGIFMLFIFAWWGASLLFALIRKKQLSIEAIWANSLIVLTCFVALWSRPFHRVENLIWLAFAFAIANRETLISNKVFVFQKKKLFCLISIILSIFGAYVLIDGLYGNRLLRLASETEKGTEQRFYLDEAYNSILNRSEAQKQLGYHKFFFGKNIEDEKMFEEGFLEIITYFQQEASPAELNFLLDIGQQLQDERLVDYLKSYLKVSNIQIERPKSD